MSSQPHGCKQKPATNLEPESLRAETALRNAPYSPLRNVTCRMTDGAVELNGRLPSYYLKQMAQTLVASATRARSISNRIEVVAPKSAIW